MKLFISSARSGSAWADWIADTLRQAGHEIFYDAWDVMPGDNFISYFEMALNATEMTVLVIDKGYFDSKWTTLQWTASFARSGAESVLAVRVEPIGLPGLLNAIRSIDLFGHAEAEARQLLLVTIMSYGSASRETRLPIFLGARKVVRDNKHVKPSPLSPNNMVFISYSHNDKRWLDRLLVHLKPLQRSGILDLWSDRRINPGQVWKHEIEDALKRARAALLLVSADFLASDFIVEHELPTLLTLAESKGTVILPLIVAPSRFTKYEELSRFQAFNPPQVPLAKMTVYAREELLVLLADRVEDILTS